MKRYYNVTGEDRKRMVSIIGEVIGEKPYYLRMPTCVDCQGKLTHFYTEF